MEVILQADNVLEPSVMLQTSRLLQVAIPHLTDGLFCCTQAAEEVLVTNNETSSYLAYIILKEGGIFEIESFKTWEANFQLIGQLANLSTVEQVAEVTIGLSHTR